MEEVLKDSDQKCGKAYDKLITQKLRQQREESAQKALLNKSVNAAQSSHNNANLQQVNAGQASKKRRRLEFEEAYHNNGGNFQSASQIQTQEQCPTNEYMQQQNQSV